MDADGCRMLELLLSELKQHQKMQDDYVRSRDPYMEEHSGIAYGLGIAIVTTEKHLADARAMLGEINGVKE